MPRTALWVVFGALAVLFGLTGCVKLPTVVKLRFDGQTMMSCQPTAQGRRCFSGAVRFTNDNDAPVHLRVDKGSLKCATNASLDTDVLPASWELPGLGGAQPGERQVTVVVEVALTNNRRELELFECLKQGSRDGTARAHVVGEAEVAGHRRPFEQDVTIELQSE